MSLNSSKLINKDDSEVYWNNGMTTKKKDEFGVVETSGRMMIMTSNHPEDIDPVSSDLGVLTWFSSSRNYVDATLQICNERLSIHPGGIRNSVRTTRQKNEFTRLWVNDLHPPRSLSHVVSHLDELVDLILFYSIPKILTIHIGEQKDSDLRKQHRSYP